MQTCLLKRESPVWTPSIHKLAPRLLLAQKVPPRPGRSGRWPGVAIGVLRPFVNGSVGTASRIVRIAICCRQPFGKNLCFMSQNNKFFYYLRNYLEFWIPDVFYQIQLERLLAAEVDTESEMRVNYYNKLSETVTLIEGVASLADFFQSIPDERRTYFFDVYEAIRYFNKSYCFNAVFGDLTEIPPQPSLVKSRPIKGDNQNSVLLNLNKIRHFAFVTDKLSTHDKLGKLVWRGNAFIHRQNRISFLRSYFGNPLCNIGKVNKTNDYADQWLAGHLSIKEQLTYKYILSLEGNDVATNLKWVMSSNSVAVMPMPKYETWFMEGRLIPDVHFVAINDDYSDLAEKIHYYEEHPLELRQIIANAHRHVAQFQDSKKEKVIALLVLKKYFELTGQYTNQSN